LNPNIIIYLAVSRHHFLASWRLTWATILGLIPTGDVNSCWKWFWWRGQRLEGEVACWRFPDERFPGAVTRRRTEACVGAAIRSISSRRLLGLVSKGLPEVDRWRSGFFRCCRPLWDFLPSLGPPPSPPNRPLDAAMLIMYLAFSRTISYTMEIITFQRKNSPLQISSLYKTVRYAFDERSEIT
jgi:hypothetical protein